MSFRDLGQECMLVVAFLTCKGGGIFCGPNLVPRGGLDTELISRLHHVPSGNNDIHCSQSTGTNRGSNLVGSDEGANLFQVFIGEYKADVTLDVWDEVLELRELAKEGVEGTADHCVLTHQHYSLAMKCDTDLVHFVGTNVVDIDKENGFYGAKSKVCFQ